MESVINFWKPENLFDPIMESPIFGLTTKAVESSLPYVKEGKSLLENFSFEVFCEAAEARTPFRDAFFSGMALTFYKVIETIFWGVMAIVGTLTGHSKALDLAKRSVVQLVSNSVFTLIAGVGMCSPLWGDKVYMWALTEVAVHGAKHWSTYARTLPEEDTITGALEKICEDKGIIKNVGGYMRDTIGIGKIRVSYILGAIAKEHVNSAPTSDDSSGAPHKEETGVFERFTRILPFGAKENKQAQGTQ